MATSNCEERIVEFLVSEIVMIFWFGCLQRMSGILVPLLLFVLNYYFFIIVVASFIITLEALTYLFALLHRQDCDLHEHSFKKIHENSIAEIIVFKVAL